MNEISRMTDPASLPLVMTAADLASFLGMNLKTVYEACRNEELPFARVGRRYLFYRDTVLDWLRGRGGVSRSSRSRR